MWSGGESAIVSDCFEILREFPSVAREYLICRESKCQFALFDLCGGFTAMRISGLIKPSLVNVKQHGVVARGGVLIVAHELIEIIERECEIAGIFAGVNFSRCHCFQV